MPITERVTVRSEIEGDRATVAGLEKIDASIEEAEASASSFGDNVDKQMREAATSTEQAEQATRSYAAAADQAQASTATMRSSVSASANNLGFEFVQAAQDARFGMAGVANQIPLMTEQFTQLQAKTGSTSGALAALGNALTGPAGIIGAFTLLIQLGPQIQSFFSNMAEEALGATDELIATKKEVEAITSAAEDLVSAPELEDTEFRITDPDEAARTAELLEDRAERQEEEAEQAKRLLELRRAAEEEIGPGLQGPQAIELEKLEEEFSGVDDLEQFIRQRSGAAEAGRAVAQEIKKGLRENFGQQEVRSILERGLIGVEEATEETKEKIQNALDPLQEPLAGGTRGQGALGVRDIDPLSPGAPTGDVGRGQGVQRLERQAEIVEKIPESQEIANQKIIQAIQLAGQLGQQLTQAFQSGEAEAQDILSIFLNIAGQAAALAGNPILGAALSAGGGLVGSFAEGGYTGPGAKHDAAGVVHRGEYVMPQEVVDAFGLDTMRKIHRAAKSKPTRADMDQIAGVPGYAQGGFVSSLTSPDLSGGNMRDVVDEVRRLGEQVANIKRNPAPVIVSRRTARDTVTEGEKEISRTSQGFVSPDSNA